MANAILENLTTAAASAVDPQSMSGRVPGLGGVDPLGLREINFRLLDRVFPGVNNVCRHIRPFTVIAWAWRRAGHVHLVGGLQSVEIETLNDFVDRIEVLFAWSQFLRSSVLEKNALNLPGGSFLGPVINSGRYRFGGDDWRAKRNARRLSTSLRAPVNYGPATRTLGWVTPSLEKPGVMIATTAAAPALEAFEALMAQFLEHPAFSKFGDVEVTRAEVELWGEAWAMERPTFEERQMALEGLLGALSGPERAAGVKLMLEASGQAGTSNIDVLRRWMCGRPTELEAPDTLQQASAAWRAAQVRQAFRLAISQLEQGRRSTEELVAAFMVAADDRPDASSAGDWFQWREIEPFGPADAIDGIERAGRETGRSGLAAALLAALRFCIHEAPDKSEQFEPAERLPLARAKAETVAWSEESPSAFLAHILESWVLAQHVYWSVGRGLADARAGGKPILRLRVTMEEGGWALAPGVSAGTMYAATPDRLETVVSLAKECSLISG
jgi:hypothetical protein